MEADEFADDDDGEDELSDEEEDDDDFEDEDEEEEEATLMVAVLDAADVGVVFAFKGVPDFDFPECRLDVTGEARRGGALIATLSASHLDRDALADNPSLLFEVADAHSAALEEAVATFVHSSGRMRFGELPALCTVAHASAQEGGFVNIHSVEVTVVEERRRELSLRFVCALLDVLPAWTLAVMTPCAWMNRDHDASQPPDKGLRTLNLQPAVPRAAERDSRAELVHACVEAAKAARDGALLPAHLRLIEAALCPRRRDRAVCLHFARLGFQQCAPANEHFFVTPAALRLCSREQAHDKRIVMATPLAPEREADAALNEALQKQCWAAMEALSVPSDAVRDALAAGAQPDRALRQLVAWMAMTYHRTEEARPLAMLRMLVTALGARVDAVDEGGNTALHVAASYHYAAAVTGLLALGASCAVYNEEGHTPAHVASRRSRTRADMFVSGHADGIMEAAYANLHAILHAHDGFAFRARLGLCCGALLTRRMHYRLLNVAGLMQDEQREMCEGDGMHTRHWHAMSLAKQHDDVHISCTGYGHLPPAVGMQLFRDVAAMRGMIAVSAAIYQLLLMRVLPSVAAVRRAAASAAGAFYAAGGAVEHMLGAVLRLGINDDVECGGEGARLFEECFGEELAALPLLPLLEDDFLFVAHALGVPEACLVRREDHAAMWRAHVQD
jgi:hypothetical protein